MNEDQKKIAKRAWNQRQIRQMERQVIDKNPDGFVRDLQLLVPGWTQSTSQQLTRQLELLQARHMFVAEKMSARKIAATLGYTDNVSEVFHWVEIYGWREMRQRREVRRTKRFAINKEVNAYMVEAQADQLMAKAGMVAEDILNMHFDGNVQLDPQGLKSVVDSVRTIYEVRGSIHGSEKVGEKLKVELSGEVQHSLQQMLAHAERRKLPQGENRLAITVEDAEFTQQD